MAMTTCEECNQEISDKAKTCPNCGAGQRPKTTPTTWVFTIVVGFFIIVAIMGSPEEGSEEAQKLSKERYQQQAVTLGYREAMLGDISKGKPIITTGRVAQIYRDTNVFVLTDKSSFGYSGDRVWLKFDRKPNIIEKDIIKVYGRYKGTRKYEATFGQEVEVPYIEADHVETIAQKE